MLKAGLVMSRLDSEGRFETSRISPGNTSKLLKIHISNFHRISISLAEVRLASGPCLESRLLFPSPTITLLSLSLSLSSFSFSLAFLLATAASFPQAGPRFQTG